MVSDTIRCPHCAEEIRADAKKCKHCGEWLGEAPEAQEVTPTPEPVAKPKRTRFFGAAIVGGFLAGFLGYMLVTMISASAEPRLWLLPVGWIIFGWIFFRRGWSSAWLTLSIMSFLLPVSVFVLGAALTSQEVDEAAQAGAAVGTFLTTGLAGIVGFFFGIMFAIIALFTRRAK